MRKGYHTEKVGVRCELRAVMKTLIHVPCLPADICPTLVITKQDSAAERKSFAFEFAALGDDSVTAISDSVRKC